MAHCGICPGYPAPFRQTVVISGTVSEMSRVKVSSSSLAPNLYLTELCQPCCDTRLRSTSRGDFIVPRFNRQLSNSSFSVAAPSAWNCLPSHIRTSSTYTLFLTRLKTHLFAESLSRHGYAVVFSLYFWRPRALDVGRHSKFMLIDCVCWEILHVFQTLSFSLIWQGAFCCVSSSSIFYFYTVFEWDWNAPERRSGPFKTTRLVVKLHQAYVLASVYVTHFLLWVSL